MVKPSGSNNPYRYITMQEASAPATPAVNTERLFLNASNSNHLTRIDSAGVSHDIEAHGSSTFAQLADVTVAGSPVATIDLTSISGAYSQLLLVCQLLGSTAALSTNVNMRLNNDSGANYDRTYLQAVATAVSASEAFAQTSAGIGLMAAASAVSGTASPLILTLPNYAATVFRKEWLVQNLCKTADSGGGLTIMSNGGEWRSTAAVTRITLIPAAGSFAVASRATLYGLL